MNHENHLNFLKFCELASLHEPILQRNEWLQWQHKTWRQAAVLVGFAADAQGDYHILLTRRAQGLRQHAGQIAFAGGKMDNSDANLIDTALRETWEETRIQPDFWCVSGSLKTFFTPSGYAITPVLAHGCRLPETCANTNEVAEIFWLPTKMALNADNYGQHQSHWQNHVIETPVLHYRHHEIWGVTALILKQLAHCWQDFLINVNSE